MTEALPLAQAAAARLLVAAGLEGLAGLMAEQGQAHLAVRLLTAAAASCVQMVAPARPADQATLETALATARSIIGADAFAVMWAEALSLEHILDSINALTSSFDQRAPGAPSS